MIRVYLELRIRAVFFDENLTKSIKNTHVQNMWSMLHSLGLLWKDSRLDSDLLVGSRASLLEVDCRGNFTTTGGGALFDIVWLGYSNSGFLFYTYKVNRQEQGITSVFETT